MPSKSKAQSRLMHAAESMKKGEQKPKGKAGEVAKSMSKKELKKFTKTKQKGLPEKKKSKENCEKTKMKKQKKALKSIHEVYMADPLEGIWMNINESLDADNTFGDEISEIGSDDVSDEVDVIEIEVPALIRIMEYVREDVQDDNEIHEIAEKIIEMSKSGGIKMDCVEQILSPENEEVQSDWYADTDEELGW
jgi:alanyl-tRNA synthetase